MAPWTLRLVTASPMRCSSNCPSAGGVGSCRRPASNASMSLTPSLAERPRLAGKLMTKGCDQLVAAALDSHELMVDGRSHAILRETLAVDHAGRILHLQADIVVDRD